MLGLTADTARQTVNINVLTVGLQHIKQISRLRLELQTDSQSKAYFCRNSERERETTLNMSVTSGPVDMKCFFQQVIFYNNEEIL